MTGLRIDLTLLASKLPDAQQELHDRITKMMRATDEHLTLIQSISSRLRPPVLDAMGFQMPSCGLWTTSEIELGSISMQSYPTERRYGWTPRWKPACSGSRRSR